MKRLILVAALVLFGLAANAQSTTPQIDTTDATTKYLLQRIEQLEHQVNFEQDRNGFDYLLDNFKFMWNDIQLNRCSRYQARDWMRAVEDNYKSQNELTSMHAVAYKYSDAELGVLDSSVKQIKLYIDAIKDWLKN